MAYMLSIVYRDISQEDICYQLSRMLCSLRTFSSSPEYTCRGDWGKILLKEYYLSKLRMYEGSHWDSLKTKNFVCGRIFQNFLLKDYLLHFGKGIHLFFLEICETQMSVRVRYIWYLLSLTYDATIPTVDPTSWKEIWLNLELYCLIFSFTSFQLMTWNCRGVEVLLLAILCDRKMAV